MIKTSISILLYGSPNTTKGLLDMLHRTINNRNDTEVLIIENGCITGQENISLVLNSGLKNLTFFPLGRNLGFGPGHNALLEQAQGEYFIALNSDLYFTDSKWVDRLIYPLENNSELKLLGLQGSPSVLVQRPDGYIAGRYHPGDLDYIEGSCLAGRTRELREFGLFDPIYEKGLFEDGDLSMRMRQAGYQISVVKIPHKHLRAQSLNQIAPEERNKFAHKNCNAFKNRWKNYMSTKQFANKINVELNSLGAGDIVAQSGIIGALRKLHKTAVLEVTTSHPDIFLNNPHISAVYEMKREYDGAYDRNLRFKPDYSNYRLIADEAAELCGVELDDYRPRLYLSGIEIDEGAKVVNSVRESEDDLVIGVHLRNNRPSWQGKCFPANHAQSLIEMLQGAGAKVIELGKDIEPSGVANLNLVDQTDFRQLCGVVANLDVIVCIDSLVSHLGRTFGILQFVLYGATHPLAYTISWQNECPIFREDLNCVGCYQRKNLNVLNACNLGTSECMSGLAPEYVMEIIGMPREDLLARNIALLEQYRKEGLLK